MKLSVNKRHDITGIHDTNGNFPYNDIFRKNHTRLYLHFFVGVINSKKLSGQELVLTDFSKYCLKMPHILRKSLNFYNLSKRREKEISEGDTHR